jgi:ElaA protein
MPPRNIKWIFSEFDNLRAGDLYKALKLRQDIFIIEQDCIYPDLDNMDYHSFHLLGYCGGTLAAYLRVVPPGKIFREPSIGRIIVAREYRSTGIGSELVKLGIKHTNQLYSDCRIRIEAQAHLREFYQGFGFSKVTDAYEKDGIPHIQMLLN